MGKVISQLGLKPDTLRGETVIVTGAGGGIGYEAARALLWLGANVVIAEINGPNGKKTEETLGTEFGKEKVLFIQSDVGDEESVRNLYDQSGFRFGKVDSVINNACLALFIPFEERTLDDIRREFEVNYFGYLNMIRAVLPAMKKQGRGVIHNFSSGVGFTGMPNMTGYISTKGAIESLTRTLALEYASQRIIFNVMHPPLTRTKSSTGLGVPLEMMADPNVVGRGLAKQVGKTAPMLSSDFMNGIQLWASYHFRVGMGRLLAMMAEKAKTETKMRHQNDRVNSN